MGDAWTHARFEAARSRIEQQLAAGQLQAAFDGAQQLLQRARTAGARAYADADYDLTMGCWLLLARVLKTAGGSEQALPLLREARRGFEAIARERPGKGAERMASACITEQGDWLRGLGWLDEAAAYEEAIQLAEKLGDDRQAAVGKGQLGTVR